MPFQIPTGLKAAGLALVVLASILISTSRAWGQSQGPYPRMAPLNQYLTDREAEASMARSAAPPSISNNATILVLGSHGYDTVQKGKNGFTCMVERAWMSPFDDPQFWNYKMRGPICYNAAATRSVLPYTLYRTKLALAGSTKEQMLESIRNAVARKELSQPELGSMSYMMSKQAYLGDSVREWHPHLMFHLPKTDDAVWGANLAGSPVLLNDQYREMPEPETIFMLTVSHWSDGTLPTAHEHGTAKAGP
jgi:hypothetical protein